VVAGLAGSTQMVQAAAFIKTLVPADFWSALRDPALMSQTVPLPGEPLSASAAGA